MDVAGLFADLFGRVDDEVAGAVEGLTPEQLATSPEPGANTIGWLVWHLTRVEDSHVAELLDGPQLWADGPWAARFGLPADPDNSGYGHRADDVASVRPRERRCPPRLLPRRARAHVRLPRHRDARRPRPHRRSPLGPAGHARRAARQHRRRRDPARRPGGLRGAASSNDGDRRGPRGRRSRRSARPRRRTGRRHRRSHRRTAPPRSAPTTCGRIETDVAPALGVVVGARRSPTC